MEAYSANLVLVNFVMVSICFEIFWRALALLAAYRSRWKVNQAHRAFLIELLHLLEEAGISSAQVVSVLSRRGINASPNIQSASPSVDVVILLVVAVDLSGDPSLMIRAGQRLGVTSFGSFWFRLNELREPTRSCPITDSLWAGLIPSGLYST